MEISFFAFPPNALLFCVHYQNRPYIVYNLHRPYITCQFYINSRSFICGQKYFKVNFLLSCLDNFSKLKKLMLDF